jgi:hypothetical protein
VATDIRSVRRAHRRARRMERFYSAHTAANQALQDPRATLVERAKATAILFVRAVDVWRATCKRLPPEQQFAERLRAAEMLVQDAISMEGALRLEEVA